MIRFVLKFPGLLLDLSKSEVFAGLYNNFAGQDMEDRTAITALTIWLMLSLAVICSQHNCNNSCLSQQIKPNSNKAENKKITLGGTNLQILELGTVKVTVYTLSKLLNCWMFTSMKDFK